MTEAAFQVIFNNTVNGNVATIVGKTATSSPEFLLGVSEAGDTHAPSYTDGSRTPDLQTVL